MASNAITNKKLYEFFINLDRASFIDNEHKEFAHYDEALPIGHEQTISKPSLVYEMTARLELDKKHKVLEIGTGSGYQTVFLAEFAGQVYTVERIKELSWRAVGRLMKYGYQNINFRIGNGSEGWPEFAPYDRIIVTAAARQLPKPLLDQLKPGGRMIIPVGPKGLQELTLIDKDYKGNLIKKPLGPVTFVEFKGEYGWEV